MVHCGRGKKGQYCKRECAVVDLLVVEGVAEVVQEAERQQGGGRASKVVERRGTRSSFTSY